jgi:hypothetical protein
MVAPSNTPISPAWYSRIIFSHTFSCSSLTSLQIIILIGEDGRTISIMALGPSECLEGILDTFPNLIHQFFQQCIYNHNKSSFFVFYYSKDEEPINPRRDHKTKKYSQYFICPSCIGLFNDSHIPLREIGVYEFRTDQEANRVQVFLYFLHLNVKLIYYTAL